MMDRAGLHVHVMSLPAPSLNDGNTQRLRVEKKNFI